MQSDQKTKNKTINSGSKPKDLFTELSKTLLHIEPKIRKNMTNLVSPYLCAWAHIFYLPNLVDWRSNEIYLAGYNHFVFVWICTCTLIPLRLQTWKKYFFLAFLIHHCHTQYVVVVLVVSNRMSITYGATNTKNSYESYIRVCWWGDGGQIV